MHTPCLNSEDPLPILWAITRRPPCPGESRLPDSNRGPADLSDRTGGIMLREPTTVSRSRQTELRRDVGTSRGVIRGFTRHDAAGRARTGDFQMSARRLQSGTLPTELPRRRAG